MRLVLLILSVTAVVLTSAGITLGVYSAPKVQSVFIQRDEQENVQSVLLRFTKPVRRREILPAVDPFAHGEWVFGDPIIERHFYTSLSFVPAIPLEPGTEYTISLGQIRGFLIPRESSYTTSFRTARRKAAAENNNLVTQQTARIVSPRVTLLSVAVDLQDSALSCEAASLRMALSYKGIVLPEQQIMEVIGYSAPFFREGSLWGDPYKGFVGDINGKMCTTGFGVFWGPIAKAAQQWGDAQIITQGTIQDITGAIDAGHTVVVWGTLQTGQLTDCSWNDPDGNFIRAFKETHVRLAVGYVGDAENPSKIILNDPLVTGRLYWPTPVFLADWDVYGRSGVVVR